MADVMICSGYTPPTRLFDHFDQMPQRSFHSIYEAGDSHKKEESRRRSFLLWPSSAQASSRKLAAAGFFYTGDSDTCQCFSCGLKLKNWRRSDDPRETHKRYAPACAVVSGGQSGNVPLLEDAESDGEGNSSLQSDDGADSVPVARADSLELTQSPARSRKSCRKNGRHTFAADSTVRLTMDEAQRLGTFRGKWRKSHVVKPEELARVGFFFTGDKDKVECAYCGVKLLNWQPGDTAYSEHFKHSPNCPLLQKIGSERKKTEELDNRGLFLADSSKEAPMVPSSSFSDELPKFAMSVVRQFGFEEELINMALHRLKGELGEFQSYNGMI